MLPSPTSLLPTQLNLASLPDEGSLKVFLAFGSSFAHGDQASHLRKSFTCRKMADGGAAIVAERLTAYSAGRIATTTANTTTTANSTSRILLNIAGFSEFKF